MHANKVIMYCSIILLFLLAATASADERCPIINPVKKFNFTIGSGVWHDLARYQEGSIEKSSLGHRYIFYNQAEGSVQFTVDEIQDGKLNAFNGIIQFARNAGDDGQLIYSIDEEGGILIYLDVVAIEYDKYLILYYCDYNEKTQKRTDYAWISARKIGGDKIIIDKIKNFFKVSGLIDPKKLIWEKDSDHELVSKLLKNKTQ